MEKFDFDSNVLGIIVLILVIFGFNLIDNLDFREKCIESGGQLLSTSTGEQCIHEK